MQLIPKEEMIHRDWRTFEHYPKPGSDIILHIKGYRIRENKYVHDFIRIRPFDASTFDPKEYVPQNRSTIWKYSWQYTTLLVAYYE